MPTLLNETEEIQNIPWLREQNVITILTDLFTPRQFADREVVKLKFTPLNSLEALKLAQNVHEYCIWSEELASFLSRSLKMKVVADLHKASTLEVRYGIRLLYAEIFGDIRQIRNFQLRWWLIQIENDT